MMSILTGPEIRKYANGFVGPSGERIVISPFVEKNCGSNSYDVHLGRQILVYDTNLPLDPTKETPVKNHDQESDGKWILKPGLVYLAAIAEYTETHGFIPILHGRSSIARLGLAVHLTAGFGDDGVKLNWTLELTAAQPVVVYQGMRIAQIAYHTIKGERKPYDGRYQNDTKPTPSRYHICKEKQQVD